MDRWTRILEYDIAFCWKQVKACYENFGFFSARNAPISGKTRRWRNNPTEVRKRLYGLAMRHRKADSPFLVLSMDKVGKKSFLLGSTGQKKASAKDISLLSR